MALTLEVVGFSCLLCKTTHDSERLYLEHLQTNEHKLIDPNFLSNTKFKCEKCNSELHGKHSYARHLKSKKHNMSPEEYKEFLKQRGKLCVKNGEENELYIMDILETLDFEDVVYVVYVGNTANMFDAFIKFEDENFYRGLQIKTLSYDPGRDHYTIASNDNGYKNGTLIIAVSNTKDKYVLIFSDEINTRVGFSMTYNTDKLLGNLDLFKIKLIEEARKSIIVNNFYDYLPLKKD